MNKYEVIDDHKKENTVDINTSIINTLKDGKTSVINTFGGTTIKHVKNGIEVSVACHSSQCNCLIFKSSCETVYKTKIFPILSLLFKKKYFPKQYKIYNLDYIKNLGCDLNIILSHILISYKEIKYKLFEINHEKQRTIYEIIACCYDDELLKKINEPHCGYKYVYLEQSLSKLKVIENMYYQAYFVTSILCFFDYYGSKKESVKSKTKIANTVSGLQGYVNIEKYRAPLIALWEIIKTSFSFWGILLLVWRRILKVTNDVYDAYYDIYLSEDKMHIDDELVDAPPNINIMFRAFLKDVLLITYDTNDKNDIEKKEQEIVEKEKKLKKVEENDYANQHNSASFKEKVLLEAQINKLQKEIDILKERKKNHNNNIEYYTKLFRYQEEQKNKEKKIKKVEENDYANQHNSASHKKKAALKAEINKLQKEIDILKARKQIFENHHTKFVNYKTKLFHYNLLHMLYLKNNIYYSSLINKDNINKLKNQKCYKIVYCTTNNRTNMCNLKIKLNDIKNTGDKKEKLKLLNIGTKEDGMTPDQIYKLKAPQEKQDVTNYFKGQISKELKAPEKEQKVTNDFKVKISNVMKSIKSKYKKQTDININEIKLKLENNRQKKLLNDDNIILKF